MIVDAGPACFEKALTTHRLALHASRHTLLTSLIMMHRWSAQAREKGRKGHHARPDRLGSHSSVGATTQHVCFSAVMGQRGVCLGRAGRKDLVGSR